MSVAPNHSELRTQLTALEDDNRRLRTALAEAEARASASGHEFLLRDGVVPVDEPLGCRHPVVPWQVSVVLVAHNAEAVLERAVRSVSEQSYPAELIELLIVDDGSTDDTRAVIETLQTDSSVCIRLLTHEGGQHRGTSPSRQLAVTEAIGEFIVLLEDTDVLLPDRLTVAIEALAADPELPAVCSLVRSLEGEEWSGNWRAEGDGSKPPFTLEQLWRSNPIATSTLTIRREALERVGGFPTLVAHHAEDWLLVMKLSLIAPLPCIARELVLCGASRAAAAERSSEGCRLETFYHLAWWMLHSPAHAEAGARFFRREYPRQIAEHQRFLPLLREHYAAGGRPASSPATLGEHLQRLTEEVESLRRVMRVKLHENKQLRRLVPPANEPRRAERTIA